MHEALRQLLIGASSICLSPAGTTPPPKYRITLPPESATQAIAYDFGAVGGDLNRAIEKVRHLGQMELELKD